MRWPGWWQHLPDPENVRHCTVCGHVLEWLCLGPGPTRTQACRDSKCRPRDLSRRQHLGRRATKHPTWCSGSLPGCGGKTFRLYGQTWCQGCDNIYDVEALINAWMTRDKGDKMGACKCVWREGHNYVIKHGRRFCCGCDRPLAAGQSRPLRHGAIAAVKNVHVVSDFLNSGRTMLLGDFDSYEQREANGGAFSLQFGPVEALLVKTPEGLVEVTEFTVGGGRIDLTTYASKDAVRHCQTCGQQIERLADGDYCQTHLPLNYKVPTGVQRYTAKYLMDQYHGYEHRRNYRLGESRFKNPLDEAEFVSAQDYAKLVERFEAQARNHGEEIRLIKKNERDRAVRQEAEAVVLSHHDKINTNIAERAQDVVKAMSALFANVPCVVALSQALNARNTK